MGIPDLLRGVQKREGYKSVAEMARRESLKLGVEIPVATMYSWMAENRQYRRRPLAPASLRLISRITGEPVERLLEVVEADTPEPSAAVA